MLLSIAAACLPFLQEPEKLVFPLDKARDATAEKQAFAKTFGFRSSFFAGEPVRLVLRIGIEEAFLKTQMIQPFGTQLDVPVQLSVPWLAGLGGVVAKPEDGEGQSFALNDGLGRLTRVQDRAVDDKRFRVYEVHVDVPPQPAGKVVLPAAVLAFAYATRFDDSAGPGAQGRAPLDRAYAFVTGEAGSVEIAPLPKEGRPADFGGAVGAFKVSAQIQPREIALGEVLSLELTIEGKGNLDQFDPPQWKAIGGFRVISVADRKEEGARTLTYTLTPTNQRIFEVPAISFDYFDPAPPAGYKVAQTKPVEVVVTAGGVAQPPPVQPVPRSRKNLWLWIGGILAVAITVIGIVFRDKGT